MAVVMAVWELEDTRGFEKEAIEGKLQEDGNGKKGSEWLAGLARKGGKEFPMWEKVVEDPLDLRVFGLFREPLGRPFLGNFLVRVKLLKEVAGVGKVKLVWGAFFRFAGRSVGREEEEEEEEEEEIKDTASEEDEEVDGR